MSVPMVRLGDVVEIKGGGTPSKSNLKFWGGDIPWVSPKDMKFWEIFDSADKITKAAIKGSATNLIPPNTILLVNRSGILKHTLPVGITRRSVAINQDVKALICGENAYPEYIAHLVKASEPVVLKWVRATTADNFPIDNLRELEIPLPSLDEQKRIAAILDKADALRAKRSQAIALLDSLTQSIFQEMFGKHNQTANDSTLLDLADIQIGYPFKSERYTEASDGIRLCRGANILPNKIDWSDLARWPLDQAANHVDYALEENDIVVAMDRPWISTGFKIASITSDDLPALLVQRVARIRAKNKNDAYFIYELMRGSAFTKHCRPTETTIPHISPKDFRSFEFNCGRVSDRLTFAQRARQIYTIKDKHQRQMRNVESLFASLQHRAFSGQL